MGWRRENRHAARTSQPHVSLLGRVGRRGNKRNKRRLSFDSREREVRDDSSQSLLSLPIGAPLAGETQPIRFKLRCLSRLLGVYFGLEAEVPGRRGGMPGTDRLPLPRVSIGGERGIGPGRGRRRGA